MVNEALKVNTEVLRVQLVLQHCVQVLRSSVFSG